jgi:glycosyltransferase involved in cell wall biosynthesis
VARRLSRLLGIPFLVAEHDFDEVRECAVFPDRRRLYSAVLHDASLLVAIADRMKNEVLSLFPQARTMVIHQGIEPLSASIRASPRPAELAGKAVVFSAGMFYERKDFPLLVRAFSRIAERHPGAVLRIAGDGAERGRIEQVIAESGMKDRVSLLGLLPHERVLQELVWSDVFALVGWDEPFATVFIEAAAAGRPMIMANDGGFNDVFRSGVHGHAVPPHDLDAVSQALDHLLSNDQERRTMGDHALRLWESELSWDQNARVLAEELRRAVALPAPPPTTA